MKRTLAAVAAAALGLCLLTACGDDNGGKAGSSGDYCNDLKAAKKQVDELKGNDFSDLEKTTETLHKLSDEAPTAVKDEWKTFIDGIDKLVAALHKAGLDDEDMATLQSGQIPDGVDMTALQGLMTELQSLDTDEFKAAGDAITKHAKDKCGVDLQT